jgi:hypothetical protein
MYGNRVDTVYGTADERDLVETWRDELGRYDGLDIKAAIDACRLAYPDYPPTLYQFSALCRDAMRRRTQTVPKIEHRRTDNIDPEVLGHIHTLLDKNRKRDPKDWARRILKRVDEGERVPLIAINGAKEALGL